MTPEEAIYCLKSYMPDAEDDLCKNCQYYGSIKDGSVYTCKSNTAREMAIEALKKGIPKKPRIKLDDYCEILYRMYCPNCNGYLGRGNKRIGYVVRRSENQKCCGECGQLIDWPEEWV